MGGRIDGQNDGQYARDGNEDKKDKSNDIKTSMLVLSTLAWSVLSFGEIKNKGWEKNYFCQRAGFISISYKQFQEYHLNQSELPLLLLFK